jgi:hypothetical protein
MEQSAAVQNGSCNMQVEKSCDPLILHPTVNGMKDALCVKSGKQSALEGRQSRGKGQATGIHMQTHREPAYAHLTSVGERIGAECNGTARVGEHDRFRNVARLIGKPRLVHGVDRSISKLRHELSRGIQMQNAIKRRPVKVVDTGQRVEPLCMYRGIINPHVNGERAMRSPHAHREFGRCFRSHVTCACR